MILKRNLNTDFRNVKYRKMYAYKTMITTYAS